jgi:acyl-CoA-binding protein
LPINRNTAEIIQGYNKVVENARGDRGDEKTIKRFYQVSGAATEGDEAMRRPNVPDMSEVEDYMDWAETRIEELEQKVLDLDNDVQSLESSLADRERELDMMKEARA